MQKNAHRAEGMRAIIGDVLLVVLFLSSVLGYLFTTAPEFFRESQGGDYPYYVQIARDPVVNAVPSPWKYRLLNSWLASWLMRAGVDVDAAFLSLTVLFAGVSCVLMRIYLSQIGVTLRSARVGAALFAVSVGAFIPIRRYYGYTDALMNAITLLVLTTALARRHAAAAATLAIGTVAKESTLLLVPFVAWRLFLTRAPARVVAALIIAPVAVYLGLRLLLPADSTGQTAVALTWQSQVDYWRTAMVHGPVRWFMWALAYSMGPIWLIAAAGVRGNGHFVRASLLLIAPLVVPLLRTTDTERVLMLTFPVVYPLAASALARWKDPRQATAVALLAVACAWLAQLTFGWRDSPSIGPARAKDLVFVALCVLPLVPWFVIPSHRRDTHRLRWPS